MISCATVLSKADVPRTETRVKDGWRTSNSALQEKEKEQTTTMFNVHDSAAVDSFSQEMSWTVLSGQEGNQIAKFSGCLTLQP